jgi:hypothetical protein
MARIPPFLHSRRFANTVLILFLLLHLVLFARAALPIPEPYKGRWPWSMFDRRGHFERRLEATGLTRSGQQVVIPLEEFFTYRRGFTNLRAYDQLSELHDKKARTHHQQFATLLAERMAERQIYLTQVQLTWQRTNLDTGKVRAEPIGTFVVEVGK